MPPITRIILYVRDMPKVAAFYCAHFGFEQRESDDKDLIYLAPTTGGCVITLLQLSKGQKSGQSCVKLVFDVDDVQLFKDKCAETGLNFGVIHRGENYAFSNARDPAKNLIQISSRRLGTPP